MEIQKTIKINVSKQGKNIICYDLPTLQLVMGSSAVSGNLEYYKVKKEGNRYVVPIDIIKSRIVELRRRIDKTLSRIEVMEQVVGGK